MLRSGKVSYSCFLISSLKVITKTKVQKIRLVCSVHAPPSLGVLIAVLLTLGYKSHLCLAFHWELDTSQMKGGRGEWDMCETICLDVGHCQDFSFYFGSGGFTGIQ